MLRPGATSGPVVREVKVDPDARTAIFGPPRGDAASVLYYSEFQATVNRAAADERGAAGEHEAGSRRGGGAPVERPPSGRVGVPRPDRPDPHLRCRGARGRDHTAPARAQPLPLRGAAAPSVHPGGAAADDPPPRPADDPRLERDLPGGPPRGGRAGRAAAGPGRRPRLARLHHGGGAPGRRPGRRAARRARLRAAGGPSRGAAGALGRSPRRAAGRRAGLIVRRLTPAPTIA